MLLVPKFSLGIQVDTKTEFWHKENEGFAMEHFKIIVEKHSDGYIAYPLGIKGVVVGEGDTYEEALADVKSAIKFHIETFGRDLLEVDSPVLEAFVAETGVAI
jgi:predicted RNase H-like HicB family nuclease